MTDLKYLFSMTLVALWASSSSTASAHEITDAQEARLESLLPAVNAIIKATPPPKPAPQRAPQIMSTSPKQVTLDVLADYDRLLDYIIERSSLTLNFGPDSYRSTKVLTAESYNFGYRELPDNITIFTVSQSCADYCMKLIFEGYVDTVTIVAPTRLGADTPDKAIKYSLDETCSATSDTSNGWYHRVMEMPVLKFCLKKEDTDIPEKGIYQGERSAVFPQEFKRPKPPKITEMNRQVYQARSISNKIVFPELQSLTVTLPVPVDHWSMDTLSGQKDKPIIRFEAACLAASPILPQAALQLLIDTKSMDWKERRWIEARPDGQLCYGPKNRVRQGSRNDSISAFFRPPEKLQASYNFEKALSVDQIVSRIKAFKLTKTASVKSSAPKVGSAQDYANRQSKMIMQRKEQVSRQAFSGTLAALATNDPRFAKEIAPQIAKNVIERLYAREIELDQKVSYFLARLPADTLEADVEKIDAIITQALGTGCEDWQCSSPLKGKQSLGSFPVISVLSATGKAGLPLLDKAKKAGFMAVDSVLPCVGDVPPQMMEDYLKGYKNQKSYIFASLDLATLPIPEELPQSPKLLRLFENAFNVRRPKSSPAQAGRYNRQSSGINLADGYSFQGKNVVFIGEIDPEILSYFHKNKLIGLLQYIEKQDFSFAQALAQTEHRDEVRRYLEGELQRLKALEGETPLTTINLSDMKDNIIVDGKNLKDLANSRAIRELEISEIKLILKDWDVGRFTCQYRMLN